MMMGVQNTKQPFYNVLPHVDDRTEESYVANNNISIVTDTEIDNPEVINNNNTITTTTTTTTIQ